MATVTLTVRDGTDGWIADVRIAAASTTTHRVRVTRDEHVRFGGGDVSQMVRRSIEFLLAREENTSVLREFSLSTIERYFPEYPGVIVTPREETA
jgi:hypothetical protein